MQIGSLWKVINEGHECISACVCVCGIIEYMFCKDLSGCTMENGLKGASRHRETSWLASSAQAGDDIA